MLQQPQVDALGALAAQQAALQVLQSAMQAQQMAAPLQAQVMPAAAAAPPSQQGPQGVHVGPPIPGVTDCRHVGIIVSMLQEKGFAFIRCPELKERYPNNDLFLHKNHWQDFKTGDAVSFSVFLNKQGKPNAKDLEHAERNEKLATIQVQAMPRQQPPPAPMGGATTVFPPPAPMPGGGVLPPPPAPPGGAPAFVPPPAPQVPIDVDILQEVALPLPVMPLATAAFEAIRQQLGGDVRLEVGGQPDKDTRLIKVRGPAFSVNLAISLLLQHVASAM
eukprot:TRINITY_DN48544_c0_g1_i1.p2 TRINITY_DN48544_c0_g1~~TRINITY_DN48544_c0_g1_i1.p2  ORF type:complete len:276 (+),score=88.39 TRINITY_DN48544_c0_g1_i1:112-939(+)